MTIVDTRVGVPDSTQEPASAPQASRRRTYDPRRLFPTFIRRRRWVLWTTAVFLLAAVAAVVVMPPRYVSTTSILIEPGAHESTLSSPADAAPTAQGIAVVDAQIELMLSDAVLMQVVEGEGLTTDPEFGRRRGVVSAVRDAVDAVLPGAWAEDTEEARALDALRSALTVRRARGTYAVNLSVETANPEKSIDIARALAAAYIRTEMDERSHAASEASQLYSGRLEALRDKASAAEDALARFRASQEAGDATRAPVSQERRRLLSEELAEARAAVLLARTKDERLRILIESGAGVNAIAEVTESAEIEGLRETYLQTYRRERALSVELKDSHPDLRDARDELAAVRRQVDAELARLSGAARLELDRARRHQQDVEAELGRVPADNEPATPDHSRLRDLEREARTARAAYQAYLENGRVSAAARSLSVASARVTAPAVSAAPSRGASFPAMLALALFAGLGVGGGLGVARDAIDPRLYDDDQFEAAAGLPILVSVPRLPVGRNLSASAQRGIVYLSAFVIESPGSEASAAMNRLWALLRDPSERYGRPQTFLVTASGQGEGKSSVALNLALAALEAGQNVLLVDCDTSHRYLTGALCGNVERGLLQLASGEAVFDDSLLIDLGPGLTLLPAEPAEGREALLTADRFRTNLLAPSLGYDAVIIDGGLVPGDRPTSELVGLADTVVMVTCRERTTASRLKAGLNHLSAGSDKMSGIVVTDG